jgi:hypothetical protein
VKARENLGRIVVRRTYRATVYPACRLWEYKKIIELIVVVSVAQVVESKALNANGDRIDSSCSGHVSLSLSVRWPPFAV